MRIKPEIYLDFDDVLLVPKRSTLNSRAEVDLLKYYKFRNSKKDWNGLPIIAANMDSTGTVEMTHSLATFKAIVALDKHLGPFFDDDDFMCCYRNNCFMTFGATDKDMAELALYSSDIIKHRMICIDVANGYHQNFIEFIKKLREKYPETVIMAGNVCTAEMTHELLINGADIVKVGIGPGSVCKTRMVTGVGYPQLSAIIECADTAHGLGGHICADGGCKTSGDIVKAFGAGADFVMIGGMLAGTNECAGERSIRGDKTYFKFYGMSSEAANDKYNGGLKDYKAAEGEIILIESQGSAIDVMKEICGGLRSACSYIGARTLKDLPKCATFIRVNRIK